MRLPGSVRIGAAAEAEAAIRLGRLLTLLAGASFRSGGYAGTPEIDTAFNADDGSPADEAILTRIRERIRPASISLVPSPFRFAAGLAFGF
jgi:hypothetical protein